MILFLKTDNPFCELSVKHSDQVVDGSWQADRNLAKDLLSHIEALLGSQNASWKDLSGLVVYRGPGSFTGLRIGATVMNTISYSQHIPIVGVAGENWRADGEARLKAGDNDTVIVPEYGRDARITKPRK